MNNKVYIVADIGGTRIKLGLIKEDQLIADKAVDANSSQSFHLTLDQIKSEIDDLLKNLDINYVLGGVGFAFAGLVDVEKKKVLSTNGKYNDAVGINLSTWVKTHYNIPFIIDNDARMAAVGEWKFGWGKGSNDLVLMTLGTGIGTAVIAGGKLLRGKHSQAGCLGGHFTVKVNGRKCTCGNRGCAEAEASTWSLKDRIASDALYESSSLKDQAAVDYSNIFRAALDGDPLACKEKQKAMDIWTTVAVNLIHAYDPNTVILGGGIAQNNNEVYPYIKHQVGALAWTPWGKVAFRNVALGDASALYGLYYCLNNLTDNSI